MTGLALASLALLPLCSFSTISLDSITPCVGYDNFSNFDAVSQIEWITPRRDFYTTQRMILRQKIRNRHRSRHHQIQRGGMVTTRDYRTVMLTAPERKEKVVMCNDSGSPQEVNQQSQEADLVQNFFEKNEWKKNFASIECGAKLVRSSENVKHPHHLITRNADEYLLYSCQEASYFVIELCETIKMIR